MRSTTRLEYPISLSYHEITFTILPPITIVESASKTEEWVFPITSQETIGSSVYSRIPFRGPCAAALTAAGLIDTLKVKGPFTVFAPTDEAFAKIPKADLDALLKDKAKLIAVLTYHVVPGKVMAKDVKAGKVKTVQGSELTISTTSGVKVDNATVVKTDIGADNGVIHVIDSVIMPK